jgi:serpin B
MNVAFFSSLAAILLLTATSLPAIAEANDNAKPAASATNEFGLDLYARVAAHDKGNLFLSPYSIETALAMTSAGARGPTAQQMARVLHLDPPDKAHDAFAALTKDLTPGNNPDELRTFELVVANALWAQQGFDLNPTFVDLVKTRYHAGLEPVDFAASDASREAARKTINAWVERQTQDKIKDLIARGVLNEQTRLVLTNAIYFKSKWMSQFDKSATKDEAFHLDAGSNALDVPMMHKTHEFQYADDADAQVVQLPYMLNRLSMLVVLPRKADGLATVEKSLAMKNVDGWINSMASRQVELTLPRFKFTSRFGLGKTLAEMGMADAFKPGADFSGISTAERLFISDVIHQAYMDVNEEGTEAAAATAAAFAASAVRRPPEKAVFKADHPFLFLIRDNASGAILFMGRVMNPKE